MAKTTPSGMFVFEAGDPTGAHCKKCEKYTDVTMVEIDVPIDDTDDVLKDVLIGKCNNCKEPAVVPAASMLRLIHCSHMSKKTPGYAEAFAENGLNPNDPGIVDIALQKAQKDEGFAEFVLKQWNTKSDDKTRTANL